MQLTSEPAGDGLVVHVGAARIDAASAIEFKDGLKALTEGAGPRVVLNLEKVQFIDSSGLGAVVGAMKQLAPDCRLELAALGPAVERVFRLTRMDSVFVIHSSAVEARGAADRQA